MDCPVCGCCVRPEEAEQRVVACDGCGTVWALADDHLTLDRVLVGAEG